MPSEERFELLTDYDTGSAYSEAYRTLFANIRFNLASSEAKLHTLLLTTASSQSVQAACAANVAIVAAQSGTPTILVDADLRKPGLERYFGLENGVGLRNLLQGAATSLQQVKECLHKTFITNLWLLGAGDDSVSGGAELLFSARLAEIVATLRQYLMETNAGKESMIFFNAPAVLTGPDASLIGAQVDQTILAIVKGRTTRSQAKQAQEQLQRAHIRLTGIVFLDA